MFGPDYELGACPGCSSLVDHLDAAALHLGHRDVTLILFSRAPSDRLVAYKRRMAWQLPYVSTYGTDFPFDFGLALTKEQAQEIPEITAMLDAPPEWLQDWGKQVGAKLEDGLRETPSWIAFARENGTVYHTYTVSAPDPFVAPTTHSFSNGRRRVPTTQSRDRGARTSTRFDRRRKHRPVGRDRNSREQTYQRVLVWTLDKLSPPPLFKRESITAGARDRIVGREGLRNWRPRVFVQQCVALASR